MRLVFCDANRILCEALADTIEAWGHQVVAITTTIADGLAAVRKHRPDLVLLDLRIPTSPKGGGANGAGGLKAAEAMRQNYPEIAMLVFSGPADRGTWSAAVKIAAAGFLSKNQGLGQLAAALDVIAAGGMVSDPMVTGYASSHPPSPRRGFPMCPLTPRETEVLRRIVAGESTEQMASEMNIAIATLRTYVKNVLTKLGAHSRLQAAAFATRKDLVNELSA